MLGFRILLGPMLLLLLLRGTLLLLAWLSDMISGFPVLTLHTLTPDSRSAWLLTAQEARRRCTLHAAHTVGQNQQFSLLTDPDSLQPVTWHQQCTCSHDDSKKLPNTLTTWSVYLTVFFLTWIHFTHAARENHFIVSYQSKWSINVIVIIFNPSQTLWWASLMMPFGLKLHIAWSVLNTPVTAAK